MATRVYVLYGLSGFISLGYQVAWFRIFTDWFGATSLTFALVVTCFIGGLATGAVLSRRITRLVSSGLGLGDALRVYGLIEIAISLAALFTLLAGLIPADSWGTFPYQLKDGIWFPSLGYRASQLLIAASCVFLPCVLMGVTFPLLCEVFTRAPNGERFPSALYAWNTLGACIGVLACQFGLIVWLGHERMFASLVGVNALLGGFFLARGGASHIPVAAESTRARHLRLESEAIPSSLLVFAVLSGALARSLEGDLFKRISFLLDFNSGATMPFISFWVIAAIFLASALVRLVPRLKLIHIKAAFALSVLYYAAVWVRRDEINLALTEPLRGAGAFIFPDSMASLLLFVGIYAFVPYLLISLLLPYVCNRIQGGQRHLGLAYGLNTLAFCLGLVFFTLVAPRLNIFYSLKLFMFLFAIGVGFTLMISARKATRLWKPLALAGAITAALILTPARFDASYFLPKTPPNLFPARAVKSNGTDTTFVVNFGNSPRLAGLYFGRMVMSGTGLAAQSYMRLMAHFPLLAHPNPKRALLICFGVGTTAAAIANHGTIDTIDTVDLNHNVFRTAPEFDYSHGGVQNDPRLRMINDDGRDFLNRTDRRYDLITSEPPPPMTAGVYRLYSREYYKAALDHLTDDGLMSQWLPVYQMPLAAEKLAVATFLDVFPHALMFQGFDRDLILVGSKAPIDLDRIEQRFAESGRVVADLRRLRISSPAQLRARVGMLDTDLRAKFRSSRVLSDQHNDLEHLFMSRSAQATRLHGANPP